MRDDLHHDDPGGPAEPVPAVWTGRATNRAQWPLAVLGVGCMALGVELAVEAPWTSGIVPLLMSVIGCLAVGLLVLYGTLAFVHVHVRIEDEVLEVRCGHVGLPRRRIALENVVGAEYVPRVTPHEWGGWGCRWRPEMGTAVVVRRGEGLLLRMGDGRRFTVTVDEAEAAVRVIHDRLRRMTTTHDPA
ncbi:hypothetical protein ABT112_08510 [Streptomyces sp. NPDC002055]|uniref:hypothetical protein n=1 Tax=Streptomyces sp. NPDC002055 TaxID=3154534 RepID=UPI00332DC9FC